MGGVGDASWEGGRADAGEPQQLRVFLSYSRKDTSVIERLAEALTAQGYLVDFDRSKHDQSNVSTGISAEDEWWERLQQMISAADVMVFAVSPDSVTSRVCDEEIAFARSLSKRVIPVLHRPVDFASVPPRLAALNVKIQIPGDDAVAFDAGVLELSAALDRDVTWLREQTRLLVAAMDWMQSGKRDEELLRGAEICEAEAWSARRPAAAPEVPELVLAFLDESRKAQGEREAKERQSLKRQRSLQRWVAGVTALALVATLAGAAYVITRQREVARSQSLILARAAEQMMERGDPIRAMRLAAIASRDTFLAPASDEAGPALASAAFTSSMEVALVGHGAAVDQAVVSDDGSRIVSIAGREIIFWDGRTLKRIGRPVQAPFDDTRQIAVSPDGATAVALGEDKIRMWSIATGQPIGGKLSHPRLFGVTFSHSGKRLLSFGDGGKAILWDTTTGALIREEEHTTDLHSAEFSKDDETILLGDFAHGSGLRRTETGESVCQPPQGPADLEAAGQGVRFITYNATFSPDGSRILAWGNRQLRVWESHGCRPVGPVLMRDGFYGIDKAIFSPDGATVVGWGGDTTYNRGKFATVWSARYGTLLNIRPAVGDEIWGALFSLDGKGVITWTQNGMIERRNPFSMARGEEGEKLVAELYRKGGDIGTDDELVEFTTRAGHGSLNMREVSLSPDGSEILVPTSAGEAVRLDAQKGEVVGQILRHQPDAIGGDLIGYPSGVYLGDGRRILTWGMDNALRVWSAQPTLSTENISYDAAGYMQDDDTIALRNNGDLVRMRHGQAATTRPAVRPGSKPSIFLDRTHAVSLEEVNDGTFVSQWNPETGKDIAPTIRITGDAKVVYFKAAKRIASLEYVAAGSGLGSRVQVWDAATGKPVTKPIDLKHSVSNIDVSDDGRWMSMWNEADEHVLKTRSTLTLWNLANDTQVFPAIERDAIVAVVFSADGKSLTLAGNAHGKGSFEMLETVSGKMIRQAKTDVKFLSGAASNESGWIVAAAEQTSRAWQPGKGQPIALAITGDHRVKFADHGRILLTASDDASMQLFDFVDRSVQGLPVLGGVGPRGAEMVGMTADRSTVFYVSGSNLASADVSWLTSRKTNAVLTGDVCARKLLASDEVLSAQRDGPRVLDKLDTDVAPVLRGREGEDVCGWMPGWYDRVLDFIFSLGR